VAADRGVLHRPGAYGVSGIEPEGGGPASFPVRHAKSNDIDADTLARVTAANLQDEFAQVMSTDALTGGS